MLLQWLPCEMLHAVPTAAEALAYYPKHPYPGGLSALMCNEVGLTVFVLKGGFFFGSIESVLV